MILEENYRKVAQYTQKAFKLYSRRYFASLVLQILQKKQKIKELEKVTSEPNGLSNFSQKQTEFDIQNLDNEKDYERQNAFTKTMKNIDMFDTLDKQNLYTDIQYLKYGDFVYLQIYNGGINLSDKNQRLRVYTQMQTLKYKKLTYLSTQILTQKRCSFKIINPYDSNSDKKLTKNSLFCLKSLFTRKFISITKYIKLSEFFGYELGMSNEINTQCIFSLKGLELKQRYITSYEPIGIKVSSYYLRAEGLEVLCSIEGSVFYFNKISGDVKNLEPQFVKIKSTYLQRYLGSSQIQISKLMNKKTYSNVTIEDEDGIPMKQNHLVFGTLDFNRINENEVILKEYEEDTMKNIWLLSPTQKNGMLNKEEITITHVCSGRSLIVKADKTIKLSNNLSETASFTLTKNNQNSTPSSQNLDQNQTSDQQEINELMIKNETDNLTNQESQYAQSFSGHYQILFQQSNVMVIKNREQIDKHFLGIYEIHSLGHYKVEENKKIKYEINGINPKQSELISELMEIQGILKESYQFIERVGFILDERNQSLRFCVQQIKKYNHLILYNTKVISRVIAKINRMIQVQNHSQIPMKKIQNFINQVKIFEIMICISKILNLKIGKKKHFAEMEENKNNQRLNSVAGDLKVRTSQTPFELCQKYLQPLQLMIFQSIYKLTVANQKSSNTIVRQAGFFNKLLMFYPEKIGKILQQAIKNLSLFTSKASNNDSNELFQWVKLIQTLKEENIMVQKTYIDIITQVVVNPLDRGIVSYQNKCRQLLFNQRNKKKIMPRFGLNNDRPTITFEALSIDQFQESNPKLNLIQHQSDTEACFFIEGFFMIKKDHQSNNEINKYIEYIISFVRLSRNLCKDRNKKLLKVVEDYGLNQAHITHCLSSNFIEWKLKIQYLLLYSSIFVDQDPFLSFDRRQTKCHIWTKTKQYNLQSKTSLIFRQYTDYTMAVEKLKQFDVNILPFMENYISYSKAFHSSFSSSIKSHSLYKLLGQILDEVKLFQLVIKFTYEAINFGYFTIYHIKRYVSFIARHYISFSTIFELIQLTFYPNKEKNLVDRNKFISTQNRILCEVLKILELNENIWIEINAINLLKLFQQNYRQSKRPMTNFQLQQHCWKLLISQIPILSTQQGLSGQLKKNYQKRRKTTSKQMFCEQQVNLHLDQESNCDYDQTIGKFIIRTLITHNQFSQMNSYSKLVQIVQKRQRRNIELYEKMNSLLIINGKKQETLYRDYSGRVTGKILNVIKLYELINRIKSSESESTDDAQDQKRKKEKIVQLNNLINKIRREIHQVKEEDMTLFRKFQLILQKLNVDTILLELLAFSHKLIYAQCISNLYKFYLEFIQENEDNRLKLCKSFQYFMNNFKLQKCPTLISELYLSLSENDKRKYIQDLFQKLHSNYGGEDNIVKENVLQTLYRITRNTKQNQLLSQIKSQFSFQIFKQNDYASLLSIGTNLSTQYINVLCELASKCNFVYEKIRQIYPKTMLRKIIYQQHKYSQRSGLLKLFYYFYINNNCSLETHEIEDIISNLILPEIKHLPSVCQYSALQNLQIKQNNCQKNQKQQIILTSIEQEKEISSLKKKFQDLILYEQTTIEPSEQEKYWNFIYNTEDESEMSLINFTILVLKKESMQNPQKGSISKKLSKSSKYIEFISYLNELCQFLRGAFRKNKDKYQRKIINKLEQILIIHEQRSESRQKTMYSNASEQDKQFLKVFFEEISKIIISENISYAQIIGSCNITNSEFSKIRAGQNVQLMVLEEQFINYIQNISKHISAIKQFNRVITQKKLTVFFNVYKCNKVRKINIYKFLEKLFEYLQSIKNKSISRLNEVSSNDDQQIKNIQLNVDSDIFSFVDTTDQNNTIEKHFKKWVNSYNYMLKLKLIRKWTNRNDELLQLVFQDLEEQSKAFLFNLQKADELIEDHSSPTVQKKVNFSGNKMFSQIQVNENFFVQWYLHKLCYGSLIWKKNDDKIDNTNPFQNNILEIDSRYCKVSYAFSRVVLYILKKINSYGLTSIQTNQTVLGKYLKLKLQLCHNQSSQTLNEIMMQLILNLNKTSKSKVSQPNLLKSTRTISSSLSFLGNSSDGLKKMTNFQIQVESNKRLARIIFQQIIKGLDNEIDQILSFNFSSSFFSCLQNNFYLQSLTPENLRLKIKVLEYGLTNCLIDPSQFQLISNCFVKIICIWAIKKYSFDNPHWYKILKGIVDLINNHVEDVEKIAVTLSKNIDYVQRFTQLLEGCCIESVKSTNVKCMTKLCLLNLLNSFHMKFYLLNQQQPLAMIFNNIDFSILASSAQKSYEQSIQPKLNQFENQLWCNEESQSKRCSYEVCNDNKITQNDQNIMQVFVSLLIIIQLSISLSKSRCFLKPLGQKNKNVMNSIEKSLKQSQQNNQLSDEINYIGFFKRFIGIVYLSSQQGSLVTLHFKIPYLEKYCTRGLKQEVLFYIRKHRKSCIEQQLDIFSQYFEAELLQRKYQSSFPLIPFILYFKPLIQKLIIVVNFVHLILYVFPSVIVNEIIFYPFTGIFICLKIIFTITQYRKIQNIFIYLKQNVELSFKEKLELYTSQNYFLSLALIILYLLSLLHPSFFGIITMFQILNLRYANKISNLLSRAFIRSVVDIILFLVIVVIFFGVIEWEEQKDEMFLEKVISSFKQFYIFLVSNFKVTQPNQFHLSSKFPTSFLLYFLFLGVFIYKKLYFFISELKKEANQVNDNEKMCFICNKKKNQFQNQGTSFESHTNFEHNFWHYLYFFIYLKRKSQNEMKSFINIQTSIKQSIAKKKYGFMNRQTSRLE